MSKADTLLKKATFFERMALYSDRKTFLQSLAWRPEQASTAQLQAALAGVANTTRTWVQQYGNRLVDASGSPRLFPANLQRLIQSLDDMAAGKGQLTYDGAKQLLSQLSQASRLGLTGDAADGWNSIVLPAASDALAKVGRAEQWDQENIPAPGPVGDETGVGGGTLQVPETTISGTPARKALPPINKADQQALARYVMENGMGFVDPAKMNDGVLGPETRKALEAVKDYFKKVNPQNPRMTDQQAIQAAKFQGR